MIIRLCKDTPKLGLRIVRPGCNGKQLMDDGITLLITPVVCDRPERIEQYWDGCVLKSREVREELPGLQYTAFEVNDDGLVIFYLDDKAWSLPPGRYHGTLSIGGQCSDVRLDLELCNDKYIIDQAIVIENPCGDNQC